MHLLNSIPFPFIVCLWFFFNKRNIKQKSVYVAVDSEKVNSYINESRTCGYWATNK